MVRHGKVEGGAEAFAKEALHLAQQIGDHNGTSNAYATLGMIAQANGKLDEAVYGSVPAYADFIQSDPAEGAPATDKTEPPAKQ